LKNPLSIPPLENPISIPPLKKKGDLKKKMFFLIKSPLSPLCQRGETRWDSAKEGKRGDFAKEGNQCRGKGFKISKSGCGYQMKT